MISQNGVARFLSASVAKDVLDQEIGNFELKQMLKVTKDVMRRNRYKHMHSKQAEVDPQTSFSTSNRNSILEETVHKQDYLSEMRHRTDGAAGQATRASSSSQNAPKFHENRFENLNTVQQQQSEGQRRTG